MKLFSLHYIISIQSKYFGFIRQGRKQATFR
jgi:hypothetical protein